MEIIEGIAAIAAAAATIFVSLAFVGWAIGASA